MVRMGGLGSALDIGARTERALARVGEDGTTLDAEALLRRYHRDVHRIVARLLGPGAPEADVEDVAQQVFISVHRALPRFRGDSQVSTWLYGIATRVVLNQLRSWRRQRRLKEAYAQEPVELLAPGPERQYQDRQELQQVWRCLLKLKPKKRVVYLLHEVEEKTAEEIAILLEVPVGTVWTRLHHARRELEVMLEKSARRAL